MKREDLRWRCTDKCCQYDDRYEKVTDDDLEQMGLVQRPTCGECGGRGNKLKRLGTVAHSQDSESYLTPAEGFSSGERLPPGTYHVVNDDDWVIFELRGEKALTNSVYIPAVKDWPFGEYEIQAYVPCPKCGGSGYGRLVSLDVDVEALREAISSSSPPRVKDDSTDGPKYRRLIFDVARQVLAALDGEAL